MIKADSNYETAQKQLEAAEKAYREAVLDEVEALEKKDDYEEAAKKLAQALKILPGDEALIRNRRSSKRLRRIMEFSPYWSRAKKQRIRGIITPPWREPGRLWQSIAEMQSFRLRWRNTKRSIRRIS
ncbi:MAG: hypothetical protein V8S96_00945 [Lachnospiraceae bacterium]